MTAPRPNNATKALAVTLLLSLLAAVPATAASVPTSEAARYVGEWTVSFEFQGNPTTMSVRFLDNDGTLGATLRSAASPQPTVVDTIATVSRGLELGYIQLFGETEIHMALTLRLERGELHGTIEAPDMGFSADVTGDKSGRIPGRALANLAGNAVKVTYGNLKVGEEDYQRLMQLADGEVFEFVYSRATKLFTDADLTFGDALVKKENAGPNYPGVYSLWLKRVGDGWSLVFNEQADVWGTQHDPTRDVAEISLTVSKSASKEDKLVIDLLEDGTAGTFRMAWGEDEWTANFKLAQ